MLAVSSPTSVPRDRLGQDGRPLGVLLPRGRPRRRRKAKVPRHHSGLDPAWCACPDPRWLALVAARATEQRTRSPWFRRRPQGAPPSPVRRFRPAAPPLMLTAPGGLSHGGASPRTYRWFSSPGRGGGAPVTALLEGRRRRRPPGPRRAGPGCRLDARKTEAYAAPPLPRTARNDHGSSPLVFYIFFFFFFFTARSCSHAARDGLRMAETFTRVLAEATADPYAPSAPCSTRKTGSWPGGGYAAPQRHGSGLPRRGKLHSSWRDRRPHPGPGGDHGTERPPRTGESNRRANASPTRCGDGSRARRTCSDFACPVTPDSTPL
ncbi:hypothetical protein JOF35_005233 [Streptomyces demainii]|uniref:Uncharacterized protein n=1 Tax=Streptomyces demainii TaxID=588122 RepID=A0ABT9KWY6_9ACTN|nr:hypothetical protein [Streptomyces demainii]